MSDGIAAIRSRIAKFGNQEDGMLTTEIFILSSLLSDDSRPRTVRSGPARRGQGIWSLMAAVATVFLLVAALDLGAAAN